MAASAISRQDLRNSDNLAAISAYEYREGLRYPYDIPHVELHHNLYHLTLEAKMRVFLLLFMIIVVPSTIVFIICYIRDRRRQNRHERDVAALLQESPDPLLPYSARLTRPVPGSVSEFSQSPKNIPNQKSEESRARKVSFASDKLEPEKERKTISSASSRRLSIYPEFLEENDDVFVDMTTHSSENHCGRNSTSFPEKCSPVVFMLSPRNDNTVFQDRENANNNNGLKADSFRVSTIPEHICPDEAYSETSELPQRQKKTSRFNPNILH